ncbi:hypothetical protein SELMODRAFT_187603 [Selaginella moellendorffii]|uniref:Dipeptidylpeptidase IV N-terminal domain-containing protein n=2 Tax=Selaginella moellendorffii TaxID=88036 RepID=D8TDW7_SELML|nr:hypothetical protein SELMODRAFT_187603 [Selaginella moellendorffii]
MALLWIIISSIVLSAPGFANAGDRIVEGTVAFASVGRAHYAFDVFLLDFRPWELENASLGPHLEFRATDGVSVNYNGALVDDSQRRVIFEALDFRGEQQGDGSQGILIYVSERDGAAEVRFNLFYQGQRDRGERSLGNIESGSQESHGNRRDALEIHGDRGNSQNFIDLGKLWSSSEVEPTALYDRPSVADGRVIFVSTRKPREQSRQSWAAVYSMDIVTKKITRLTPEGVTDYSPSVSPSGKFVMVASDDGRGWGGEIEELDTDLYSFQAWDGSGRKLVVKNGGWPSWSDDSTVFFHRRAEDGWWSVYKATFSKSFTAIREERITPPGVHAFTPAASRTGKWIAVATRRAGSLYRHVEVFDLGSRKFHKLSELVAPEAHHYNPFVSPESDKIGYHRCRGKGVTPRLEHIKSPVPGISLVRVDGDFPVFSPDGESIAFIPDLDEGGIYVTRLNGSGMTKVFDKPAFGLSWDKQRKGVLYTSYGPGFVPEDTIVHIVSILNADELIAGGGGAVKWKILTKSGTKNNAFPSPSPDGKWIVFRSGRSGHKNLYIMDAIHGEEASLRRLTEGAWTDTMASWSHDGEWIAFSSDRHNPGGGSFQLYFVRPDGSQLHRVLNSSTGGRVNHPFFSPDSRSLVFTTDYAGVSADPIAVPAQFQPYGEIFMARIDGSELVRLTHNAYEDGTPSWGPVKLDSSALTGEGKKARCGFRDTRWLKPVIAQARHG